MIIQINIILVYIVSFIIGCFIINIFKLKKEVKIVRHNYINCLKILSETDPELKKYLEKKGFKI